MRNIILLLLVAFTSCTADEIQTEPIKKEVEKVEIKQSADIQPGSNLSEFTVVWESNQTGASIEIITYIFRDCELIIEETKVYSDKKINVTLKNNQPFSMQILRESSVKNPSLYLGIYKGSLLQYEHKAKTNGYILMGYIDDNGNVGE